MTKVRKIGGSLNLSETMQQSQLPFNVEMIEKDHPFRLAQKKHHEAQGIIDALVNIESCFKDALNRAKKLNPGSDEHSEVMAAVAVLSSKRAEAKKRYVQYVALSLEELRKV